LGLNVETNSYPAAPEETTPKTPRVPAASHGINVNFCKNPSCANFGVPAEDKSTKGHYAVNRYTIVARGKGIPMARCNTCGEHLPLKSNEGVFEETWRIWCETFGEPSCPVQTCANHRVPISDKQTYYLFGLTKAGSQRYRCRCCNKIFSVKPKGLNPIARQQQSSKNLLILELLVNKMPLRRVCEVADVSPRVLYERIDFFHEQALALMAEREAQLPNMDISRLYIGVDRQDYAINWTRRKDKRNIILTAVASADNLTGYVFGMHPNFDPEVDANQVEQQVRAGGDDKLPPAHRRFARLWLQADFDAAVRESNKRRAGGNLLASISNVYEEAALRDDIEATDSIYKDEALPDHGMLCHAEYTLYGHFMRLERLFGGVEKIRFFLDQDSGMRAACLGAFAKRIKERSVDAFYVSIAKDQTVDQKRLLVNAARDRFKKLALDHPGLKESEVKLILLKQEIQAAQKIGQWKDRWVMHPLPTLSEAEKASCFLTDMGDYDLDHQAWLHDKASLHAVDTWFNRIRRRNSMLERPIGSGTNQGRTWNGYSAYKPEQIAKLLTILRVCHNYVWMPDKESKGVEQKTPAMRLGLAKGPLGYKDIVYFV
jgi:transposase-like protein